LFFFVTWCLGGKFWCFCDFVKVQGSRFKKDFSLSFILYPLA
jgi:hypothetical protein